MSESPAHVRPATGVAVLSRVVRFRLRERAYAIPMAAVSGLAEARPFRRVTGAPPGVLGLAEWRGLLLTVLDLPALVDDGPLDAASPGCLLRLAEPLRSTAFLVPAQVHLERLGGPLRPIRHDGMPRGVVGSVDLPCGRHVVLDPERMVAELEFERPSDPGD